MSYVANKPKQEEKAPAKKEKVEVDFKVLNFYDKVRGLLSDAGRYAHSFKLRENLDDEATYFKVAHVFSKYYDSDPRKLNDDIHFRRRQCFKTITEINRLCAQYGMKQVNDKEVLTDLLLDEDRRAAWKRIANKHQKKNEVMSLQAIELEYRKTKKAP